MPSVSRALRQSRGVAGLAVVLVFGLFGIVAYAPLGASSAAIAEGIHGDTDFAGAIRSAGEQILAVDVGGEAIADRAAFESVKAPPVFAAASGTPDPGSAQAYALDQVLARGWGTEQYDCLVALWNKESGWRFNAHNKSSGAYGIPQALPGSKMASAGADWQTNPKTQINWGLGYVTGRYGTPCGAWNAFLSKGWY